MTAETLLQALVTLVVTVDPIALAPVFLAVTGGMAAADRRQVARHACLVAFAVLAAAAVGGAWLLGTLGISMPAFRIAGGLLLFWIAFEMVFARHGVPRPEAARGAAMPDHVRYVATFPLAIPLMAGPGAIAATILLAGEGRGPAGLAVLIAIVAVVIALCWLVYRLAEPIDRLLGTTGNIVLSRLLGLVLAALAVQFVIDGVGSVVRAI